MLHFERINTLFIYPPLLERLTVVLERLAKQKLGYIATQGFRTYEEQDILFGKRPRVTKAKGGESAHNFGLAIDFVRDLDLDRVGLQPGWDAQMYLPLCSEVVKAGLHSGLSYNDSPHVGWPRFVNGKELGALHDWWDRLDPTTPILSRLDSTWRYMETISKLKLPEY